MPEHPSASRSILIAALALFGAAAAQAAPARDTSRDASPAITFDQLGGTWKNDKSGVNIRIEQGAVGWEVWFSSIGEARITLPEKNRPAIKIDGRNFTCSYSVTLPTPETMKWDLTQGQPEAQCLTGVFTRLGPAPSEVKRTKPAAPESAAKLVVKHEPAIAPPPAAVSKPRRPEPVVEAPVRMPRHAAVYRRLPARIAIRHRGWRIAAARRRYAASHYRPYRFFHYRYRWYVVLIPRCACY
jgi:hypothetical protein